MVGEVTHTRDERGILGHQPVRLQDLGLVRERGLAQAGRSSAELLRRPGERGERSVRVGWVAARGEVPQDEGPADGDPGRRAQAGQHGGWHHAAAADCSSAARMRAVDVAPGS